MGWKFEKWHARPPAVRAQNARAATKLSQFQEEGLLFHSSSGILCP
jgi:hypothetical protein